jgi:large subunit ribosomal protein L31
MNKPVCMQKDIHPTYNKITVTCACGNSFLTGSTLNEIRVELCSKCHPFYTGTQRLVDTARRVEKFQERADKKSSVSASRKGKKVKKATETAKRTTEKKELETNKTSEK